MNSKNILPWGQRKIKCNSDPSWCIRISYVSLSSAKNYHVCERKFKDILFFMHQSYGSCGERIIHFYILFHFFTKWWAKRSLEKHNYNYRAIQRVCNFFILAHRLDFDLWINRFNCVSRLLKSRKSIAQNA